jgi:hypothetical protein
MTEQLQAKLLKVARLIRRFVSIGWFCDSIEVLKR